ncbi:MAG: crossover junction endodeoxyribonuclease RuvC, partial [Candidatus Saccharimonadales bacterium]
MIILGIDPGTATTGYGIIEIASPERFIRGIEKPLVIDFGCIITLAHQPAGERLQHIHSEVKRL